MGYIVLPSEGGSGSLVPDIADAAVTDIEMCACGLYADMGIAEWSPKAVMNLTSYTYWGAWIPFNLDDGDLAFTMISGWSSFTVWGIEDEDDTIESITITEEGACASPCNFSVVGLPNLTSLDLSGLADGFLYYYPNINTNAQLTSFAVPATICGMDYNYGSFGANALDETTVDAILAACVAGGAEYCGCYLDGGTNAAPSAAGLANKATLVSRWWDVFHN